MMGGMDAEPVPIPGDLPRTEPKQPLIWIRIDGQWCKAWIISWFERGGWNVWAEYYTPDVNWPQFGAFKFDGEAIRERHGDTPPG